MNLPSPVLRTPSPIRWERAGVRAAVAGSWAVSRSERNKGLSMNRCVVGQTFLSRVSGGRGTGDWKVPGTRRLESLRYHPVHGS
jgi:hypothetical protein